MLSAAAAILISILLQSPEFRAGRRALLECTANEPRLDGSRVARLEFRTSVVEGWPVSSATLLLHSASRVPPRAFRIALNRRGVHWLRPAVRADRDGWIRVELPRELLAAVSRRDFPGIAIRTTEAAAFDSRETVQYAPYLLVTARAAE